MAEFRRTLTTEKVSKQNMFGPGVTTTEIDEVTVEGTAEEIIQIIVAADQKDARRNTGVTIKFGEPNAIRGEN